jgi:PleD family two-component response regulator
MARSQTILIIDDDPTIQLMTSAGLRKSGYAVEQVGTTDEALEWIPDHPSDAVLASVNLPGRDGFAFIEAVRAGQAGPGNHDIPIIILTALDDTRSIHRAFTVGGTDFITKPVNLVLLVERVKYALAAASRARALADAQIEQATACRMARLGFWRLDGATGQLQWSSEAAELLGCDALPTTRQALIDQVADNDRYRLEAAFDSAIGGGRGIDVEFSVGLREDRPTILRLQSEAATDASWLIGAFQNVTALRAFQDRARYLADYDELTDLPRRRLFNRLLSDRIRQQSGSSWSVTVIAISGLKRINTLLGMSAGDQVVAT